MTKPKQNCLHGMYILSPLGAAMIEALPDRGRAREIGRQFREHRRCPASNLFPADAVVEFYRALRLTIEALPAGEEVHGCDRST